MYVVSHISRYISRTLSVPTLKVIDACIMEKLAKNRFSQQPCSRSLLFVVSIATIIFEKWYLLARPPEHRG